MHVWSQIRLNRSLRRLCFYILRKANRDITIRHHWVNCPFRLNLYHHKGYWFYGRQREVESIEMTRKLLDSNDVVFEVGAHIGYLSLIFAAKARQVLAFEPGGNNLPYLGQNTETFRNITIVEQALSDQEGEATFYLDPITGQNNTLLKDYSRFSSVRSMSEPQACYSETKVMVTTMDAYAKRAGLNPTFIKIDVEGCELQVLNGARETLRLHHPKIFLEVTENHSAVQKLLQEFGYVVCNPAGRKVESIDASGNYFALLPAQLPPMAA